MQSLFGFPCITVHSLPPAAAIRFLGLESSAPQASAATQRGGFAPPRVCSSIQRLSPCFFPASAFSFLTFFLLFFSCLVCFCCPSAAVVATRCRRCLLPLCLYCLCCCCWSECCSTGSKQLVETLEQQLEQQQQQMLEEEQDCEQAQEEVSPFI